MMYRPKDPDGDWLPVISKTQMLSGTEAVMAVVNSRLRLLYGEWWEDGTLGFAVPQFLWEGLRLTEGRLDMLANYIASYIEGSDGVNAVNNAVAEVDETDHHNVIYSCTLDTGSEADVDMEVLQDVLLPAVS